MPRATRRATAALSLIGLGMAVPLSAEAAGTCTAEALTGLNVPSFTVTSAKEAGPEGPVPARCVVEGRLDTYGEGRGAQLGPPPGSAPRKLERQARLLRRRRPGGFAQPLGQPARLRFRARPGLRDRDHGHRPCRQEPGRRRLDPGFGRQAERGQDRRLFLPRAASGDDRRQGAHVKILWRAGRVARLLRRMLVRRPHGAHGSDALPGRL